MRQVALAKIVDRNLGILVGGGLVVEDATSAEAVVGKGEIELRRDVLRRQDVEIVGLPVAVGQERTEVASSV